MSESEVTLELGFAEVDVLHEILSDRIEEWELALKKVNEGEASLIDLMECDTEVDVEYQLELYQKLRRRFSEVQVSNGFNDVEFIEETHIYRPEQSVETLRVRNNNGVDQLVYLFVSRHGVFYLYPSLEELMDFFLKDKESKLRFECRKEFDHFLNYWRI